MADLIQDLIKTIDGAVERFNKAMPGTQQRIFNRITLLLKDLELQGDTIKPSVNNLRIIGDIKSELQQIFRDAGYMNTAKDYMQNFNTVTNIQNKYFTTLSAIYKPSALLKEIRSQSINATATSLTGAGIDAGVIDKIIDLLRINITTGAKFTDLNNSLREFVVSNQSGVGVLERYTKQITTDALNQYSAQYINVVANDLGLEWFMYTGTIIATSRPFCVALVKKKYIHLSELPDIIKGNFTEFKDIDGAINSKTGLPEGMVAGTNPANFHIYRGGYQCGHQLIPVANEAVPPLIRNRFSA